MCLQDLDYTERSCQQWNILAPRRRKIQKLEHNHSTRQHYAPLEYLFDHKYSWNAWSKLARYSTTSHDLAVNRSSRSSTTCRPSLSKLESLPSELLASILEVPTLAKGDIIALGLASETLWMHVLQHVERHCSLTEGSMAGVEIACTGSYLTDLPESFARDDLAGSSVAIRAGGLTYEARKINWAASQSYDAVAETPEESWWTAWRSEHGRFAHHRGRLHQSMSEELLISCSALRGSKPDALWVLRNLATREYVLCRPGDGIQGQRGIVRCDDDRVKLRIDDVLLMRICWTRTPDDRRGLEIFPGKWAGHCFDIVRWEQLDGGEGWNNCTKEVLDESRVVAKKILPVKMMKKTFPKDMSTSKLRPRKRKFKA